jgi:protein-S-isoprenylcysteine O-methyltransferase Ste14
MGWQNLGSIFWLILCATGGILGLYTLCHNKIGNFSVYPEIKQQAKLITTGPYQYIRHPMYTSLIVMMIGISLYNYHWINTLGLAMVFVAVILKANTEERLLVHRFPKYPAYQRQTQRFIPFIY